MNAIDLVLDKLRNQDCSPRQAGRGWTARCPAHEDRRPSLSVARGRDDRVLMHCHAGCPTESVLAVIGLSVRDLMPSNGSYTYKTPRQRVVQGVSLVSESSEASKRTYPTARAAIEDIERRRGKRSASWVYRDLDGEPVGVILRWNHPDGKMIIPVSRFDDGWRLAGMPVPRPLYRLADLVVANRIYITEGEKAADAARSMGLIATTSAHGSQSPQRTDWSPLAGRECVILPDNDDPGHQYAEAVDEILDRLRPRPVIKIIDLPDLPPGGDLADLVETGRSCL